MRDLTVKLKDGRNIGIAEYGKKDGIPVFFFHGTPGSRLIFLHDDETAKRHGIRIISLDRPGFGLSDPKPNRTLLDWPDDVEGVADLLGIEKFSIIGVSGGGAFAAACAYKIPHRLHSVNIVSGPTPFQNGKAPSSMLRANKIAFFLSRRMPWLVKASYRAQKKLLETQPEKFKKQTKEGNKHLNDWDRQFLQTDEQIQGLMLHLGEAFKVSVDECVNEPALLTKPWGFSISETTIPIDVWHGEKDQMAPFAEMKELAKTIPNCETHFFPEAAHFLSDDEKIWEEILLTIKEKTNNLS